MTTTRIQPITLQPRPGNQQPVDCVLEDYTGYWLFEDGTRIAWAADAGTTFTVKARSTALKLQVR